MKWSGKIHWKRFSETNPKTWPTTHKPVLLTYAIGKHQYAYIGFMDKHSVFVTNDGDVLNPVWYDDFGWAYVDRPLWWNKSKASTNKNSRRSQ